MPDTYLELEILKEADAPFKFSGKGCLRAEKLLEELLWSIRIALGKSRHKMQLN